MKRFILTAIAASMLATTGAYADQRPYAREQGQFQVAQDYSKHRKSFKQQKHVKKQDVRRHQQKRWGKGQRMQDWKRHGAVRDYHRHGLRKPGRGQQWIKVDNDYLLIAISSGVIAGILAGR
jgi:Ni/Co efflux regulator RcnB